VLDESAMGLHIDIDGVCDLKARTHIESAIRECIGEPPGDEDWNVSISGFGGYSVVVVRTPRQARRKMFFSNVWNLSEAIPEWLQQYPLR
jgi:hypothetical protein